MRKMIVTAMSAVETQGSWIESRYDMMAATSLAENTNVGISGWRDVSPSPKLSTGILPDSVGTASGMLEPPELD